MHDGQRQVDFKVYQGESRDVAENVLLGSVSDRGAAQARRDVQVACRFSYDVSGLLEVDVIVPETGRASSW